MERIGKELNDLLKPVKNTHQDCFCYCHTDKYKTVDEFKKDAHWKNESLNVANEKLCLYRKEIDRLESIINMPNFHRLNEMFVE